MGSMVCSHSTGKPVGLTSLVTSVPFCFQRKEQGMFACSSPADLPQQEVDSGAIEQGQEVPQSTGRRSHTSFPSTFLIRL